MLIGGLAANGGLQVAGLDGAVLRAAAWAQLHQRS